MLRRGLAFSLLYVLLILHPWPPHSVSSPSLGIEVSLSVALSIFLHHLQKHQPEGFFGCDKMVFVVSIRELLLALTSSLVSTALFQARCEGQKKDTHVVKVCTYNPSYWGRQGREGLRSSRAQEQNPISKR